MTLSHHPPLVPALIRRLASQQSSEFRVKLDKECWSSKKGESVVRSHSSVNIKSEDEDAGSVSLTFSAFGQLHSMLANPTIKRSSLLTDKLLSLLSLISQGSHQQDLQPLILPEGAQGHHPAERDCSPGHKEGCSS